MYIYDANKNFTGPNRVAVPLALGEGTAERVLEFVWKWGRNAGPFTLVKTYLRLNWKGLSYWADVRKAAKSARSLQARVKGLEQGARVLRKAADELSSAESKLPVYPLKTGKKVAPLATQAELDYVERYFNTAALIANEAMSARAELDQAVDGWKSVLAQAETTQDFTRKAVWATIVDLDRRFNKERVSSFLAYLVDARDRAARTESWARLKQYHAAHILGKWTPEWYRPPTP